MRMIIVPIIGIAVIVIWVCFSIYFLLWLMSCGAIEKKSVPIVDLYYYSYVWTDE